MSDIFAKHKEGQCNFPYLC